AWSDDELGPVRKSDNRPQGSLSSREREVLTLVAEGHSLSGIAERLTISLATVRTHVVNAYRKLGARNRSHAIALALRDGLITPGEGGLQQEVPPSSGHADPEDEGSVPAPGPTDPGPGAQSG